MIEYLTYSISLVDRQQRQSAVVCDAVVCVDNMERHLQISSLVTLVCYVSTFKRRCFTVMIVVQNHTIMTPKNIAFSLQAVMRGGSCDAEMHREIVSVLSYSFLDAQSILSFVNSRQNSPLLLGRLLVAYW